jgi:hypothetical protein
MLFQRLYKISNKRLVAMVYDQMGETGSGKFKMAASKLELLIVQLIHKIVTKYQLAYLGFLVPVIKID